MRWSTTALAAPGVSRGRRWQRLGGIALAMVLALAVAGSGSATVSARAAVFTGYGFDACTAPDLPTLGAWLASPYRAIGIYVGGVNRGCANTQLSADWVAGARGSGWNLVPLYVGLQAPCVSKASLANISPAAAPTQGTAAADDAIARAAALGLDPGTPIYFDMEGYAVDNPTCSATVQAFVAGWVNELHAHGYVAGVYGSAASTIRDLQSLGTSIPDSVWIANWNGQESVFGDPYVSDALWTSHQRIHQFRGGHREAYGGITINIDSSYVDGPVVAATGTAPPPVTPPPITPPPAPPAVSTAGSVTSGDGQATVGWAAGTFSQSVVVSLTPASPTEPVPGFGGGYGVRLAVSQTASAAPSTGFAAPLTIRFVPQPGNVVALFSTDGTTWKTVAPLVDGGLAAGAPAGFSREGNGSIEILTSIPGFFALLSDTTRPTRPAALDGRFSHGSLLLRWPTSTDNSGRVAGYEVTLTNRPLLTVTGKPAAAVRSFHHTAPSVYRVVAVDAAGNESLASKPVVVLPTKRPAKLPKAIPRWAFALFVWQQTGKPEPRPDAPRIVPAWYWQWAAWRATPFHIRRP